MASTVTVKLKYDDGSRSFTESYQCADTHPSAEVINDCEGTTLRKWEEMGNSYKGLQVHISVKPKN